LDPHSFVCPKPACGVSRSFLRYAYRQAWQGWVNFTDYRFSAGFSTPAFSCQNLSSSMDGPRLISTCFGSFEIECQEVLEHLLVRDVSGQP
jgi:hypothetical protein